jgi:hypothetical protein
MRSKIKVFWTTNPANFGYDGQKSTWSVDTMSVRKASEFLSTVEQSIGHGVYVTIQYFHNGESVSIDTLQNIVMLADMPRKYR